MGNWSEQTASAALGSCTGNIVSPIFGIIFLLSFFSFLVTSFSPKRGCPMVVTFLHWPLTHK